MKKQFSLALFQCPSLCYTPCLHWIIFYCSYSFIIAFILCFYLSRGVQSCFIVITFKGQGRGISQVHIMGSNASAVFQYRIEWETQLTDPSMNGRVSATSFSENSFSCLDVPRSKQVQVSNLGWSFPRGKSMGCIYAVNINYQALITQMHALFWGYRDPYASYVLTK